MNYFGSKNNSFEHITLRLEVCDVISQHLVYDVYK